MFGKCWAPQLRQSSCSSSIFVDLTCVSHCSIWNPKSWLQTPLLWVWMEEMEQRATNKAPKVLYGGMQR